MLVPPKINISAKFANMSIISALMVVLIHVLKRDQIHDSSAFWFRYFTGEGVCRVAVPFFFLASGYFIAQHFDECGYWRREVVKRIKTLLIPFFVWCGIAFVICSVLMALENMIDGNVWYNGLFAFSRLLRSIGLHPFNVPELRQLWFIRVLFLFALALPLFRFYINRFKYKGVALLFILYFIFKPFGTRLLGGRISEFLNFGYFSFEGAAFFSMGIYLACAQMERIFAMRKIGILAFAFGMLIMSFRCFFGMFSWFGLIVSIPFMLYGFLTFIPERPFRFFSGFSFPIYLIHLNIVFIYFIICDHINNIYLSYLLDPGVSVVGCVSGFIAVFAISIKIAKILKFYATSRPVLGGILFGGRI